MKEATQLGKKMSEDRVKALYNAGYTMTEISKHLNTPESVVRRIVEKSTEETNK